MNKKRLLRVISFLIGLFFPLLFLYLRFHRQQVDWQTVFVVVSAIFFLIFAMGAILLYVMDHLYDYYNMGRSQKYCSSSAVLGQLERLTYTIAILAHLWPFIGLWIGVKTFSVWAEWKLHRNNPESWAISLTGNLMNIIGAVLAAVFISTQAHDEVIEFLKNFG